MAQTKAATSKSKRSSRSSPKSNSKPKASSRSKPSSSRRPKSNGQSKPKAVVNAVEGTAKDAGSAVGRVASRAKVPLVAGGAALAGVAGGLAFGTRQAHRHGHGHGGIAGLRSDDVAKAARKVGDVGMQMGQLAYELRSAREAGNGNGKAHRSPVEVVLEGLTARRERH